MALDLTALSRQIRAMGGALVAGADDRLERRMLVLQRMLRESSQPAWWSRGVDLSAGTAEWLLARPVEPLNTVRDAPAIAAYALIASDGSQIDVERHGVAQCYVINIGRVFLRYGDQPLARLSAQPALYWRDEDLYITDGLRRIPVEGACLSARRDLEESLALAGLADEWAEPLAAAPGLALQDGTLVRWTLANADPAVRERFLVPFLRFLDAMRQRGIPVASYISRPRAPEVIGSIRLMFCPDLDIDAGRPANCRACSDVAAGRPPSCHRCDGLTDADVLGEMLADGQRGPLFVSMSRINIEAYGPHLIHFFYVRVGRELARIEIPQWVARDPALVDRVHAVAVDQAARGRGYPVALARAHEQAVVRSTDRRAFLDIVESSLRRSGLEPQESQKRSSKDHTAV
jgi:hypothetical protein